jgi:hypothetical protein
MRSGPYYISLLLGSLLAQMLFLNPSEVLAFSYTPTSLSFSATTGGATPSAQSISFGKRSLMTREWTATASTSWVTVTPTGGTISTERDSVTVQVNPAGLTAGTYNSSVRIVIPDKRNRTQTATVPITMIVTNGTTTSTPSISVSPTAMSFSGTAGGGNPSAKTINLSNPTGGTLTWSLVESAPWLGLSVTTGSTTTETDQISASVNIQGLAAGTYNMMINVSASGASNSPQQIPVTMTLSQPATTTASLVLSWTANTETDIAGYKVYVGTQPGIYNAPISIGNVTSYTVTSLSTGRTYYASITAFDSAGNESLHSAEVSKTLN